MSLRVSFSEMIRVRAPEELCEAIQAAAARDLTTPSEFVRRALIDRLRTSGVQVPSNGRPLQGRKPTAQLQARAG